MLKFGILVTILAVHAAASPAEVEGRHPDIVLIVIDAQRPDRLNPYGAPRDTSPNIARFASRGALFERAVAQSNWTLPSLASIMTGLYPSTHQAILPPEDPQWALRLEQGRYAPTGGRKLDATRSTLAQSLARVGYRTAAVVSGGFCRSEFGFDHGFSEYRNLGSRFGVLLPVVKEVLAREPARPFFVYLHLSDVHDPYAPPPPFDRRWDSDYQGAVDGSREILARHRRGELEFTPRDARHLLALYDGAIAEMDERLGELFAILESTPSTRDAVVVLTADHGESFGEHGRFQHGSDAYDEQIRVPLIIHAPGHSAGIRLQETVELVDLMPTLLELAGAASPSDIVGRSLVALLDGRPWTEKPAFTEAVLDRTRDKSIPFGAASLRSRNRKFVLSLDGGDDELFDLANDPGETHNLIGERPAEAGLWRRMAQARIEKARADGSRLPRVDSASPPMGDALRAKLRASGYIR